MTVLQIQPLLNIVCVYKLLIIIFILYIYLHIAWMYHTVEVFEIVAYLKYNKHVFVHHHTHFACVFVYIHAL